MKNILLVSMALLVVLSLESGCRNRQRRAQRQAERTSAPAPEPVGAAQVPAEPSLPPGPAAPAEEVILETDAPPPWWFDGPRWQGTRVRIAVMEESATIRGARVAAVDRGLLELRRVLGRDARDAAPEQTVITRAGSGYRAYVLISGE